MLPSAPADQQSIRGQRIELHLLAQLHAGGCGARIVEPLAVFRYAGEWFDDPDKRATRWYEVSLLWSAWECLTRHSWVFGKCTELGKSSSYVA